MVDPTETKDTKMHHKSHTNTFKDEMKIQCIKRDSEIKQSVYISRDVTKGTNRQGITRETNLPRIQRSHNSKYGCKMAYGVSGDKNIRHKLLSPQFPFNNPLQLLPVVRIVHHERREISAQYRLHCR